MHFSPRILRETVGCLSQKYIIASIYSVVEGYIEMPVSKRHEIALDKGTAVTIEVQSISELQLVTTIYWNVPEP